MRDPRRRQTHTSIFRNNIAVMGGLLMVIDLSSGDIVHYIRFEGNVSELHDVVVMPGVKRPMAIGLQIDEIRRAISTERLAPPRHGPIAGGDTASLF